MNLTTVMRFGSVGAVGALLNETVLYGLHAELGLPLVVAAILATEIAIVGNYIGNELWTFSGNLSLGRLARFQVTSAGGLVITVAALWALTHLTPLDVLVANLAAIAAGSLWNLFVNVGWTFNPAAGAAAARPASAATHWTSRLDRRAESIERQVA